MKKHGFRSIFSLLLALMMVCSMLPTAAFAEGDVEEQPAVVEPVGTPAEEPKQDEVKQPEGETPEEPKQPEGETPEEPKQPEGETPEKPKQPEGETPEEPKQPEDETSQGPAKPARAPSKAKSTSVPLTLRISSYGAPFKNGSTGEHNVNTYTWLKYIRRSDVGSDNASGSAHAYFKGSNESGWQLWLKVEVGNYKYEAAQNAWVYNKDMSAATGNITYGLSFNTSGGTSTSISIKGATDQPQPTPFTFILRFDVNGGTGTFADVTKQSSAQYEMLQIPSTYVPTREGHTFKGWKDTYWDSTYQAGASVNVNRTDAACTVTDTSCTKTLYAVWEKNAPNGPTNGEVTNLLGQVKVHCTTLIAGHEDQTYGLHYALSFMDMLPDGSGYTCNVRVEADDYVTKYNGNYPGTDHVLADGENRIRFFVLRNDNDGKGWYISEGRNLLPIVFNVKCEAPTPPSVPTDKEIAKALEGRVNVVVSCVTENSGHPSMKYPLFAYVSGLTRPNPNEVTANSDGTYSYTVSFLASNFVKMYSGAAPFGIGSDHELADAQDLRTVTLTLRDSTVGWTATTQDIKVSAKCETENPPVDIKKPTFDELKDLLEVKVECTNESAAHELKFERYALKNVDEDSKFAIGDVDQSGDVPTCTVTIGSQPYVAAFDGTTGKAHEEADTTKTVDLVYIKETGKWALKNADDATVVFQVACTTEEPEGPGDITDEDLKKLSVVINCTNEAAAHEDKSKSYALDKATCVLNYTEEGYACEITVPAAPYVNKYTSDTKTNHGLVNPEESSKTITLRWNTETKAWAADPNSVTFDVKCEEEPVEETYTVTYKDGAGGTVFADDVHSGLKSGVATPNYKGGIPTRDGFTFLGWEPEVVETVTGNATYTAEWKKYPAPPTELGTPVKVVCDTKPETHTAAPFALIEGTYTVGNVYGNETDGYKCDITITADEYVASYNTRFGSHTLPGDPTKTLTLKFVEDRWIAEEPAIFHVECEESITKPEAPKAEDLLSVVIHCKSDVHNDGLYDLTDGIFTVGEVEGNEADGYTCKVTVEAAQYVNKYVGEMKVNHDIVGEGTKTVTLRYESALERWIVDSTVVTFDVECIPAPNISMLQVQVHCVTPNSSHMDGFYDLPEDTTLEYVDANTRKITVQAAPYVEQYGNGHELADGESESKTITATWDGVKWVFDATSVTFYVKCETQPKVPGDITDEDLAKLKVVIHCTTNGSHTDRTYDLIAGTYRRDYSNDGGFTCYIAVLAAPYVNEYISDTGTNHELVDPQKSSKTITLRWNTETKAWAADPDSVTFDVTCENVPAQKYTVTYTDGVDGVEIFKDQVYADLTAGTATPKFDGTPTRVGYFFAGWNPAVTATVTGNVTYTATWKVDSNNNGKPDDEEERYTVTYLDGANGKAFASQVYPGLLSGTATPKFNGTPARSGYVFIGWSPVWSGTVTGNVTYTATWSTITGGLDKVPKTGDNGLTLALSALLLFSFCGAAACVVSTKKRG